MTRQQLTKLVLIGALSFATGLGIGLLLSNADRVVHGICGGLGS